MRSICTLANQPPQLRPDAGVEGMFFRHLDVIDARLGGALIHSEDTVALVTQVTDGDLKLRIAHQRAEQDGLFGTSARAADAAQLQDANGPVRSSSCSVRPTRAMAAARQQRKSLCHVEHRGERQGLRRILHARSR